MTDLIRLFSMAINLYRGNENSGKQMSGGNQNIVFACIIGNEEHFIRITPINKKRKDLITAEIEWIQFLSDSGVPVSLPIRSIQGTFVEEIVLDHHEYVVVCFTKAPGRKLSFNSNKEDWNSLLFNNWGKLTAKIHKITITYRPSNKTLIRPSGYVENEQLIKSKSLILLQEPSIVIKHNSMKEQIEELPKDKDFGLIHNDNQHGNLHVDHEWRITLFDFDEAANYWFANEIAIPLYDAIMDKCTLEVSRNNATRSKCIHEFFSSFIEGYNKEYTINDSLLKQVPLFLKIRDIQRYILMKDTYRNHEWAKQHLHDLRTTIEDDLPFSDII